MAEINHEIPPPIRWSVQPVPSFNFSLAASWAGFYGVSADALFSEMSQFGYALLGFELHNSEHNMWFVRASKLAMATGAHTPPWEAMVEAFWKAHFDSKTRGGDTLRRTATPFRPDCVHIVHCPLRSIVTDSQRSISTRDAPSADCGKAGAGDRNATSDASWLPYVRASKLLAQGPPSVAASVARSYDAAIRHGPLPHWAVARMHRQPTTFSSGGGVGRRLDSSHGAKGPPCEWPGMICKSDVGVTATKGGSCRIE